MKTDTKRGTPADLLARDKDGRWTAGFDRVCTCGHTLGVHSAAKPHTCFAGDLLPEQPDCQCEAFQRAR